SFSSFSHDVVACSGVYSASLHDALPICASVSRTVARSACVWLVTFVRSEPLLAATSVVYVSRTSRYQSPSRPRAARSGRRSPTRSEEHTSELQSLRHLVCRLLLEKKNRR